MRILVITSCTGEKRYSPPGQLTREDFKDRNTPQFKTKEKGLLDYHLQAEDLYTGQQHLRLMRGVQLIRERMGFDCLNLHILSAGYGLIPGNQKIAPYECTFQGMKANELRSWADMLRVPQDIREVLAQPYDLGFILLGDAYLKACNLDEAAHLGGPTILFCGGTIAAKLPDLKALQKVVLTNNEAKRFSCGLVGLKGELGRRALLAILRGSMSLNKHYELLDYLETVE